MATEQDVRKIALSLPGTVESEGHFAFSVRNKGKLKGFAWVWLERKEPRKPRVPNMEVLAVRVPDEMVKQALLTSDAGGKKFLTEPHYDGFPAVLVRLKGIRKAELAELLDQAWRCLAPRALVKERER